MVQAPGGLKNRTIGASRWSEGAGKTRRIHSRAQAGRVETRAGIEESLQGASQGAETERPGPKIHPQSASRRDASCGRSCGIAFERKLGGVRKQGKPKIRHAAKGWRAQRKIAIRRFVTGASRRMRPPIRLRKSLHEAPEAARSLAFSFVAIVERHGYICRIGFNRGADIIPMQSQSRHASALSRDDLRSRAAQACGPAG